MCCKNTRLVSISLCVVNSKFLIGLDLGLHACVQHYFNVQLNKEEQTSDWRVRCSSLNSCWTFFLLIFRPLSQEMLEYARLDVHYLLPMYSLMKSDLIAKSLYNINPSLYSMYSYIFIYSLFNVYVKIIYPTTILFTTQFVNLATRMSACTRKNQLLQTH